MDTAATPRRDQPIRAAELVGALSLATDLGTGQPLEHALRTAVLAVRLGELAGASAEELADTYYVALLHGSGCTSNGHEATLFFGEDIEHRAAYFLIDPADPAQVMAFYRSHVGPGRPPEVREQMIDAALADPSRARESFAAMCEVAQRFAGWLGLPPGVESALEFVFARWDGRGLPRDVAGETLPLPARLLHVARDFSLFLTAAGFDDARAVLERRAGAAYEPLLAELAARHFDEVLDDLDEAPAGQTLLRSTRRNPVATRPTPIGDPIKVGVIADQTGPLSFVGLANANVARMVVADVNFEGGLLGRPLELYLEDSATDDDVAAARATKLVEDDHVDVIFGGIYSSTRQAIKARP